MKKEVFYRGTGRRKTAIAQVVLMPGKGNITINGQDPIAFFPYPTLVQDMEQPLVATETKNNFDVTIKVCGGGFSGQAGAARLAIARALLVSSQDYKIILRQKSLVTRDARIKERKKYGLKAARKAPQFSKR